MVPIRCGCVGEERRSVNQLLGLEILSQVEYLPGGQAEKTHHTEDAEEQHAGVSRLYKKNTRSITLTEHGDVLCYMG